jgi:hypothetical protein
MWSETFLAQAKSEWQVYEHLKRTSFPECHALHYLQMATEKLAKAYLLAGRSTIESVRLTHRAFLRFLQLASRNDVLREETGMTAKQLRMHVQKLLPLAYEIENLAPAVAGYGPNSEYPWASSDGVCHAPATHRFAVSSVLDGPRGVQLMKFLRMVLTRFHTLHSS